MILLIDNYDSFTYNLFQYLSSFSEVRVVRNDELTLQDILALSLRGIVLSPGPGRPEDSGVCLDVLREFGGRLPVLGVCLGHQALGLVWGAHIVHAPEVMHGRTSRIRHDGRGVFAGLPSPFVATRYHSLSIASESFPDEVLEVTARAEDGVIMGVRHRRHACLEGVQFHPESILTEHGMKLIENFVSMSF